MERLKKQLKKHKRRISSESAESEEGTSNLKISKSSKRKSNFYPGIKVVILHEGPLCKRCKCEKGAHRFSHFNNMDPGEKNNERGYNEWKGSNICG